MKGLGECMAMGFDRKAAEAALRRVNGDVERAVVILLQGPPPEPPAQSQPTTVDLTGGDEDEELRRAIEMSKEQERKEKRERSTRQKKAATSFTPASRGASNNKAAEAALSRVNGNGEVVTKKSSSRPVSSHPFVKMPKTLAEKSYNEQVVRTVFRVSSSSLAVDTLIKTLETIKNNSTNPKYRTINIGTRGFKKALDGVPGVIDLLTLGVGFKRAPDNADVFRLDFVDEARFYAVLSSLKGLAGTSHAYQLSRIRRVWEKRLEELMADDTTTEVTKRGEFLRLSPSEPGFDACSIVTVNIMEGVKISRRFAADDTVIDVLRWIAGSISSKLYEMIEKNEIYLVNLSKHPKQAVGASGFKEVLNSTLQVNELWPSAELDLVSKAVFELDSDEARRKFEANN